MPYTFHLPSPVRAQRHTATAPDSAGLTPPLPLERAHKFAPFGRPMDVLNFSQRLTAREPLAATATFKCPSVYVNVPAALVSCSAASASPAVEFDVFVADRRCWLRCPPSRLLTTSGAGADKTARAAAGGASRDKFIGVRHVEGSGSGACSRSGLVHGLHGGKEQHFLREGGRG